MTNKQVKSFTEALIFLTEKQKCHCVIDKSRDNEVTTECERCQIVDKLYESVHGDPE